MPFFFRHPGRGTPRRCGIFWRALTTPFRETSRHQHNHNNNVLLPDPVVATTTTTTVLALPPAATTATATAVVVPLVQLAYATGNNNNELVAILVNSKVKTLGQATNPPTVSVSVLDWIGCMPPDLSTVLPWAELPTKTAILRLLPLIRRTGRLTVFNVLHAGIA